MSLEERVKQIRSKADKIMGKANAIMDLADFVLEKRPLNGSVTLQYSTLQKQQIINHYETLKTELQNLAGELP